MKRKKEEKPNKLEDIDRLNKDLTYLSKRITRRQAISTAGKVGIGAAASTIIAGGGVNAALSTDAFAQTSTTTQTAFANLEDFTKGLSLLAQEEGTPADIGAAINDFLQKVALLSLEEQTALDAALGKMQEVRETGVFSDTVQQLFDAFPTTLMTSTSAKVTASASQVSPQRPKIPPSPLAPFTQVDVSQNLAPQNEPSIAANPNGTGNLIATANDYRLGPAHCGRYVSLNGGQSWSVDITESNGFVGGDPSVAFDSQGNAYLNCLFERFRPSGLFFTLTSGLEVSKSADAGQSWSFPVIASESPEAIVTLLPNGIRFEFPFNDKPYIAAGTTTGGNAVYISYTFFDEICEFTFDPFTFLLRDTSQIKLVSSPDGVTWSSPVDVSPQATFLSISFPPFSFALPLQVVQGSNPWVSSDGKLDVAWYDSKANPAPYFPVTEGWLRGEFDVKVRRSIDGGASFGDANTIATKTELAGGVFPRGFSLPPTLFRAWSTMFPVVRTDPRDSGKVYAAFGADPDPYPDANYLTNDDSDIFFVRSTDGGTSWGPSLRVNDDTTLNDQFFPWMSVQPDGTIFVSFGDRREDSTNRRFNIFLAASKDGGISFKPNQKVTAGQSDSNTQFQGLFMGDYFGLASDSSHIYASWTDTRFQGSQSVFVGIAPSGRLQQP